MLLIRCPWCGEREETEFHAKGEGGIRRPAEPAAASDAAWADYLFMRRNAKGRHHELWLHAHGCRRWFHALRDTVSHEIVAVWRPDEDPPEGVAR